MWSFVGPWHRERDPKISSCVLSDELFSLRDELWIDIIDLFRALIRNVSFSTFYCRIPWFPEPARGANGALLDPLDEDLQTVSGNLFDLLPTHLQRSATD